jgi:hypothetical protein
MKRVIVVVVVLLAVAAGYAARGPIVVADDPALELAVPAAWGPLVSYSITTSGPVGSAIGYAVFVDSEQTIRVVPVGGKSVMAKIHRTP